LTLVTLSTGYFFLKYSRRAMLDVPVAAATTLGVYALARADYEGRKGFYLLFGAAAALGYYFKGVQGLYLLGIAPAYFLLSGQVRKIFSRHFLGASALALFLIALWAAPQALKYGREFVQSQSGIGPLTQMGVASKHSPFYEPFMVLLGVYWPWIPFSLFGLWTAAKGLRGPGDPRPYALVLAWFVAILFALSASSAFYLRYLIPLVPPLGIFAALALGRLIKDADMGYARHLATVLFSTLALAAACLPVRLDRQGTQYISFYRTVNQVVPGDARLLLYKDKGYRFIHGLVFYSGRTLDGHVKSEEALLAGTAPDPARTFVVATAPDFKELSASGLASNTGLDVAASADNWYLFRVRPGTKKGRTP
ncbi:MAG TPA: glycosyltransferase family 39 protein, partial [Elusimicrobiales bacterium]|nr:glycosyltransferase family 39 protein [Elusimicrobiales bacterium]